MSEPATDKQIEFIKGLGGKPERNLTKEKASELIGRLLDKKPATEAQLGRLKRLGASIQSSLTENQAKELIKELDGEKPPTKSQIEKITDFGVTVPETKREAEELYNNLVKSSLATTTQKQRANEFGLEFPDDISFLDADEILSGKDMDNDSEHGKPPTKVQINKIIKLGGNPEEAINRWRADDYIEDLEEGLEGEKADFECRVEEAIDWFFEDPDTRSMMSVKKPSKAVMSKAIRYGEAQGWGGNWEESEAESEYDQYSLMEVAIYSVAPDSLKKGKDIPTLRQYGTKIQTKGKGCLAMIVLFVGSAMTLMLVVIWTASYI